MYLPSESKLGKNIFNLSMSKSEPAFAVISVGTTITEPAKGFKNSAISIISTELCSCVGIL